MEKIKNLSLRKTFVLYIGVALVVGFFVSVGMEDSATKLQQHVWLKYYDKEQLNQMTYDLENYAYGYVSVVTRVGNHEMSNRDVWISEFCDFIQTWSVLLVSMSGCVMVVFLFYKHKIREPIRQLDYASKKIARNELDFTLDYQNEDELGKLCTEFERMRIQLSENNQTMWGMIEKEKALRAAIAHDIRSPLSILKGYQEMLLEFIPEEKLEREKLMEVLQAGMGQIERLHGFVDTMRQLSSLEDREMNGTRTTYKELSAQLQQMAEILTKESGKSLVFLGSTQKLDGITVDSEIVFEVYENLLSNAIRYANKRVEVEVSVKDDVLQIALQDDGIGFTEDTKKVTKAYYHANPISDENHFGLGLYIARMYCEKHGGRLLLGNTEEGGAYAKARFKMQ